MPRRTDTLPLLAAAACLLPLPALALPEDSQQPIQVTADNARFDERSGEAVYRGNVQIIQGTLEVLGDSLTLKVDGKGRLTTARTLGKPAHYQQRIDPDKGMVTADANEIQFDNSNGVITLIGNAVLRQDSASFKGPRIVYSTTRKQIEASGSPGERVQLVFPPSLRDGARPGTPGAPSATGSSKP
ncbi:MAG: lipopolysaccharide transport periplasmic protein LptA [Perlucidibaca sp.]